MNQVLDLIREHLLNWLPMLMLRGKPCLHQQKNNSKRYIDPRLKGCRNFFLYLVQNGLTHEQGWNGSRKKEGDGRTAMVLFGIDEAPI